MGKLGKETKNLLLAITVICLISFLLAAGLSFLLAKGFQHEMLLHDYGVSGYQLNHEDKLQISAFTAHPNESDIERGKEALASIGYSEATSMQLLPTVREYRNQTMLYLFLLLLFLFGMVYLVLLFYLRRQHFRVAISLVPVFQSYHSHVRKALGCSVAGIVFDCRRDSRNHGAGCTRPSKKITRYVDCGKYQFTVKQTENLTPS